MPTAPNALASSKTFPLPSPSFAITRPAWANLSSTTPICTELTTLRDQLKVGLSGCGSARQRRRAELSELAEKIKALKAANTIEATPQRARQKHSTAEEPVTARIRRRKGTKSSADQAAEPDARSGTGETLPATDGNASAIPPMTFEQRLALGRQAKDQEPSLP